ncbi:hypothetical protein C8Q80DRAFT_1123747 [Daedaleopsis nitida]|nr:hypothetical protein C8Q80DRAFT_1123747 [Daedaleopsis nitida]
MFNFPAFTRMMMWHLNLPSGERPELKHQVEIEKPRPNWKGYPDGNLGAALTFMLKKPGAKLPLLPTGTDLYPPPTQTPAKGPQTPVKELQFDLSNLFMSSSEDDTNQSSSARTASAKKREPDQAFCRCNEDEFINVVELVKCLRSRAQPPHPAPEDPLVLMLRRFIQPPNSMGRNDNPRLLPLNFGRRADDMFLKSGVDTADLLAILQIYRIEWCWVRKVYVDRYNMWD